MKVVKCDGENESSKIHRGTVQKKIAKNLDN